MKSILLTSLFALLGLLSVAVADPEPYSESSNAVRIFDWDTFEMLHAAQIQVPVRLDTQTTEDLSTQLQPVLKSLPRAEKLRFVFPLALWDYRQQAQNGGKIGMTIRLELTDEKPTLLTLIRWISELNQMTFTVKKGEIVFRPLVT